MMIIPVLIIVVAAFLVIIVAAIANRAQEVVEGLRRDASPWSAGLGPWRVAAGDNLVGQRHRVTFSIPIT